MIHPDALYGVESFPPTIRARDGYELIARPIKTGEAACRKCSRALTLVEYVDRRTWRAWAICLRCAKEAGKPQGPPAPFVLYDDEEI